MNLVNGFRRAAAALVVAVALVQFEAPVQAQSSASADTSAARYDKARRVVGTIAPDPDGTGSLKFAAVRNTYDVQGRLVKVEKGELASWQSETVAPSLWSGFAVLQVIDIAHDSLGRKVKEILTGGGDVQTVTQFSYDAAGRLECTAVRMNPAAFTSLPASACTLGTEGSNGPDRITRNIYSLSGELLQVREGVGTSIEAAEVTYTYTQNGRKQFVTDANGNRAQFAYDPHDRLSRWYFPSKTTPGTASMTDYEEYEYDENGNRKSLRKRDGQLIVYTYDALNRVIVKDLPGAAGDVSYSYDLRGLQLGAAFAATGQGITNAWDNAGRLTSTTSTMGGASRTLSYLHDANGNRTHITHPDGVYFTTNHDGMNRPNQIFEGAGTSLVAISYDKLGRRSTLWRAGAGSTGYVYDNGSRLSSLAHDLAGTADDLTLTFAYSPASQVKSHTRSNTLYSWTDAFAVNRPYAVNGLNQYTAAGQANFNYDGNGNLTGALTSGNSSTFAYDVENRLTSASGANNATLAWDPLGRLASVTSGGTTTSFLYDGDDLVAEYSGASLLRRYVHGSGADEPLIQYEGALLVTKRHLHADHQGSVIAVTDANGNRLTANTYDEYGIPGSVNAGRFQFTGQAWLSEIGMYHYKARIYSPTLGRFLQTDPIGYDDQFNLYAYVGNDPVNNTDSTGEAIDIALDIAFIAMDAADMRANGLNWTNGVSMGANILGAAIPGATGLGAGTRALMNAGGARGRAKNFLKPEPKATGPHSTFRRDRDGNVRNTATWKPNSRQPSGYDLKKRVDVKGTPHVNKVTKQEVPTPHVQSKQTAGGVRPAKEFEKPKACSSGPMDCR